MRAIKILVNRTRGSIEPFWVAYYSIMEPGSVSSLLPATTRVVAHDGMVSVRIIRIQENNLWGVRRGGQSTN